MQPLHVTLNLPGKHVKCPYTNRRLKKKSVTRLLKSTKLLWCLGKLPKNDIQKPDMIQVGSNWIELALKPRAINLGGLFSARASSSAL